VHYNFTCSPLAFLIAITALFLFSCGCQLELLVGLVYVHHSLVYKYPPGELLQTHEVLALSLKSLAMDILVCEVEQPPGISRKSCKAYSEWKKSCDKD
jgi:hypothetical protein